MRLSFNSNRGLVHLLSYSMRTGRCSILVLLLISVIILPSCQKEPEPLSDNVDTRIERLIDGRFGCSVLIGTLEEITHQASFGHVNSKQTAKVNRNTLFNIASISKSFTALGIFKLVEQGKLQPSDSIEKYFDNVPKDKQSVTIEQLLSHTSGYEQNYVCDGLSSADSALGEILSDRLMFAPGEGFSYSNENYELLALLIETVTSETYEEFVQREIIDPLKMIDTYFWDDVDDKNNVAEKNEVLSIKRDWGYIGSGGIYSTTGDLYRFWRAVIGSKLITEANTKLLFDSYYRTSSGISIGYGWFVNDSTDWNSQEIWTRGNESWGHNAVIRWFPEKNTVIIVISNSGEMGDKQTTGNRLVSDLIADFLWK